MASENVKSALINLYSSRASINFIDEVLPVNVTFNHSCKEMVKANGEYEGYLYIDSGIHLDGLEKPIQKLYDAFKSGPYGMLAARTNTDTGSELWFGSTSDGGLFQDEIFIVPVGKAVNLHVQVFSNQLLRYYNGLMPDIFASYCTESVFSFLCAALDLRWGVYRDLVVNHVCGMDGGSAGFNPLHWKAQGKDLTNHPFRIPSVHDVFKNPTALSLGLGYEECGNIAMHDPSKYNEGGYATESELKNYIRDHLFLSKDLMDYDSVNHIFIGV